MSNRTNRRVMTPQASVLKELREKHKLSMRTVGAKIGWSDSYISQIENGRADCPRDESLDKLLKLYGGIGQKYFFELCRDWEKEHTDEDYIRENLSRVSKDNLKLIKAMLTTMLENK